MHCSSAESEMFGLVLNTQRLTKAAIKALDLFCTNMQREEEDICKGKGVFSHPNMPYLQIMSDLHR